MSAFVVEPVLPQDVERIYEVECLSFSVPWSRESLLSFISNTGHTFCIKASLPEVLRETDKALTKESVIIGYIGIMYVLDEGEISNIAVRPDFRGQGVGFLLLSAALEGCRNSGIKTLHLEVRPSNASAIALYEKCGFIQSGLRRGYYADNDEDALLYSWHQKS